MQLLVLTHYFPPEGNAPATRMHALARRWVEAGHHVTVITCAPNVPDGRVYEGYRNRLIQRETVDGIEVIRVWTYIAANKGMIKRIANYTSYMVAATLRALPRSRPDVVIATSPQFFCGWAGVLVSRLKRVPLILDIRDLWPESIVAVGAMQNRRVLRFLEWLEQRMYRAAAHIVTVGEGYRRRLMEKDVPASKLSVITNGVDTDHFAPRPPSEELRRQVALDQPFLCSYLGTIGMACGLEVVLDAAHQLVQQGRDDIGFLLVGDGARRESLEQRAAERGVDNVVFTGRQDKSLMPDYLSISDCCLVHLRRTRLFTTVLPSKIFEMAAMEKPIILGVEGEAAKLIEASGGGLCITPDDAAALVRAVTTLADQPALRRRMGRQGREHIATNFDSDTLAARYLEVIGRIVR